MFDWLGKIIVSFQKKKREIWKREGVSDASCVTTLKCEPWVRVKWTNTDLDVQAAPQSTEWNLELSNSWGGEERNWRVCSAPVCWRGNISQSFQGVCRLQSRELSVSSIIHPCLSLPVPGYLQIESSTFQPLLFLKDEARCIQKQYSTSFSPSLQCFLVQPKHEAPQART